MKNLMTQCPEELVQVICETYPEYWPLTQEQVCYHLFRKVRASDLAPMGFRDEERHSFPYNTYLRGFLGLGLNDPPFLTGNRRSDCYTESDFGSHRRDKYLELGSMTQPWRNSYASTPIGLRGYLSMMRVSSRSPGQLGRQKIVSRAWRRRKTMSPSCSTSLTSMLQATGDIKRSLISSGTGQILIALGSTWNTYPGCFPSLPFCATTVN
jgi:hypothetical protein